MPFFILLCLLSDQRMQNVIPLYQRGMTFRKVILLASAENGQVNPRFARTASGLQQVLGDRAEWLLYERPVDPMAPEDTLQACRGILGAHGGASEVVVNFTGGTKPMSIGAYQAGREAGAALLYVDTQAEQIFVYKDGLPYAQPFDLEPMPVTRLLGIHGRDLDERGTQGIRFTEAELRAGEQILEHRPQAFSPLMVVQTELAHLQPGDQPRLQGPAWDEMVWLAGTMEAGGLAVRKFDGLYAEPRGLAFLTGGWLEAYVYQALGHSAAFSDVAARLKIAGVVNELDVVCTLNAKLGVVECKSGQLKGQTGQAVLNKLRTLRETLGGTFARAFLVTTQPKESLTEVFRQRASEYVNRIIGLEDLHQVETVIASILGSRRR